MTNRERTLQRLRATINRIDGHDDLQEAKQALWYAYYALNGLDNGRRPVEYVTEALTITSDAGWHHIYRPIDLMVALIDGDLTERGIR